MNDTTWTVDPITVLMTAKAYAEMHILEGCEEIKNWETNGILGDGVVRKVAEILKPISSGRQLMLTRSIFHEYATRIAATQPRVSRDDIIQAMEYLCPHEISTATVNKYHDLIVNDPIKRVEKYYTAIIRRLIETEREGDKPDQDYSG